MPSTSGFLYDLAKRFTDPFFSISVVLLIIFLIITSLIGKECAERLSPPEKIPCPVCGGAGLIEDQVHDSDDIQFTRCGECAGTGEVLTKR